MSSQVHPTHNDLERLFCDQVRCNIGPLPLVSIEQHLMSCRLCRLRMGAIRRFVEQLATGRIRSYEKSGPMKADHISVDDMNRYHSGQVYGQELAHVEEHLLGCQHCMVRMEATEQLVGTVPRVIVRGGFELELEA